MAWLTENWFWVLGFIAFIAMHLFGHGRHGGHGGHNGGDPQRRRDGTDDDKAQDRPANTRAGGHQH